MSVTSELLYRFTFIIELHYISLSKVSLCEWVLRDRSRWIVGHWNSWPSSVNFLNYGGPEGQHTKIFHKKRSTVAGVLSKHTHKKRCYPTFSVNWNVVCALTVRGRHTKPNQTIITEWAAELTSYDQSQSVGQDTDIGQQIQEHNKLRERRNIDVIVKLNYAITQWAPVMWRGRLYCHWESTPPLCTKQKDIIWFNNVGNFSQSCPHTPKKLIHRISSLYIVVSVVILWSHSDLDRVDDAVDENQAFDFCHTECDQQHRLFHQHHRLLICQGAVIVQIRPEDRDARTLKSTKSWVHVGNSRRWGGKLNQRCLNRHWQHSLEGVDPGVPAQQLQQFIVEAEGKGDAHGAQTDVGEHGDGTELEHAGQTDHQPREHDGSPPHVPPVHQIHNWTRRRQRQRMCHLLSSLWYNRDSVPCSLQMSSNSQNLLMISWFVDGEIPLN